MFFSSWIPILTFQLDNAKHLPSPLCERDFGGDSIPDDMSDDLYGEESRMDGGGDSIFSVSLKDDLTMEISKFVRMFLVG